MKWLLDTQALLWFDAGDERLGPKARSSLNAGGVEIIVSAASVWELAIKFSRGKLRLPGSVEEYVDYLSLGGYTLLSVTPAHAAAVEGLAWHHRDPFDRLLVAQALWEQVPVVTNDRMFRKYGVETHW